MSWDIYISEAIVCDCGKVHPGQTIFDSNYTSNVHRIFHAVGFDVHDLDGQHGQDPIDKIKAARDAMQERYEELLPLQPANGWGSVQGAIGWLTGMLKAAREAGGPVVFQVYA